jgi:putative Ca2+/H+ antiporter (TMEM165/GDT1 family)
MTAARVLFPLAAILRIASRIICLVVIASFVIFAVGQTSSASTRQQNELNGTSTAPANPSHKSAVHKAIDEAADKLTSPFSGITAGANSQWAVRGVGTVMALLVYGVGLGYLARVLRIRA